MASAPHFTTSTTTRISSIRRLAWAATAARITATAAFISASVLLLAGPAAAQSALLDSVKTNPAKARALCAHLKELNAQGISSTSPQAVALVAREQNLSAIDAEVLTTYVVGLYCPDVR